MELQHHASLVENRDILAFGCLNANESPKSKISKVRNPDAGCFRQIDNQEKLHLHWNIRASWLIAAALERSGNKPFANSRELEAALFMIGYDLGDSGIAGDCTDRNKKNLEKVEMNWLQ